MEKHKVLEFRLKSVLDVLAHQRHGADVHVVANMKHVGGWLLDIVKTGQDDGIDLERIERMTKKLEKELTDFFMKKYSNLYHH